MKKIFKLFLTFFKIGAFTFGGGYAMIPLIQRETVEHYHWVEEKDILDIIAVAESTPGPIAINAATFVGYQTAGFWGAFSATMGVIMPSFFIILLLSVCLSQFESLVWVQYAFQGIRVGVTALILKAMLSMYKQLKPDKAAWIIIGFSLAASLWTKVNVLGIIIICAVTGLIISLLEEKRRKS